MTITFRDITTPLLRRPLFCLALLWAFGTVLGASHAVPWTAWLLFCLILLVIWALALPHTILLAPLALAGAAIMLAAGMSAWRFTPPAPGSLAYLPTGGATCRAYVLTPPVETPYGWHGTFRVTARRVGDRWQRVASDIYLSGNGPIPNFGRQYEVLCRVLPAREAGNPYGFSWRDYLVQHGLRYRAQAYRLAPLAITAPTPPLHAARACCSRALAATMPGNYRALHAQVLEGLVLGVYGSPLPDELTEQFRRAGIIHLLVVSGSQVALLGGLFLVPMLLLPYGHVRTSYPRLRTWLLLVSLPILVLYALLADRGPSVDRALLVVALTAVSLFIALSPLGKRRSFRPDRPTLLAAAGLALLIINPAQLFHPGLQLSFAAVFGLLTITPVLVRLWHRVPRALALPLAATLGAQLLTLPVLVWHFGSVLLIAPLTNVLAVPLVALILPLGVLALFFALTVPPLATAIELCLLPLIQALLAISAAGARVPWAEVYYFTRSPWCITGYLLLLGSVMLFLSRWCDSRTHGWDVPAGREPLLW